MRSSVCSYILGMYIRGCAIAVEEASPELKPYPVVHHAACPVLSVQHDIVELSQDPNVHSSTRKLD
jgi:hypothetical protein